MITFAEPFYFRIAGLLVALVLVGSWSHARRRRRLAEFAGGRRGAARVSKWNLYRAPVERVALLSAAALALGTAAAGPAFRLPPPEPTPDPPVHDILIAIDVSASMQATDVTPTRLSAATAAADALIGDLDGSRVGLMLFAGRPYPLAPPTLDHAALRYLLGGVTSTIASAHDPGSLPSAAISAAAEMLDRWDLDDGSRSIVLITDGEAGEVGQSLEEAARVAAETGIRIHTIGVGTTAGAQMIMPAAPFQLEARIRDAEGNPAVSRLETDNLRRTAEIGGGTHVMFDVPAAVAELAEALAPPAVTTAPPPDAPVLARVDLTFWFAAAALILLLIESLFDVRLPSRAHALVRRTA